MSSNVYELSRAGLADQIRLTQAVGRIRPACFTVINALDRTRTLPGEKVLATAIALVAMCQSAGLSLDEVVGRAQRMVGDADGPFTPYLAAVRDYAAKELRS